MKIFPRLCLIAVIVLLLESCTLPNSGTNSGGLPTQTETSPTETPETASATLQPSPTPNLLLVSQPDPATVAYDFVAQVCSAVWSTNASFLPCPGHLDETDGGYIEAADHTVLEEMISVEVPLLIGLPGKGYPAGIGLFGKYPPFTVYPGDTFKAVIACQGEAVCSLEFALEYYDSQGTYFDTYRSWIHQAGDGPQEISVDLTYLAGQTVDFMLVLRAQGELADQWAVWIQPYIARDPDAQPAPTVETIPSSQPDTNGGTPGVISGMVAMESAPPYLNDSYTGNSTPVAVVFFNLDDGTYWWIHTSLTGHPYYQMTVPPGKYQVAAYAQGVADLPYVVAGYTGQNPSCGKNLKTVVVPPNGRVENIVIADWNWTCGGTAYRPDKPGGVPLP